MAHSFWRFFVFEEDFSNQSPQKVFVAKVEEAVSLFQNLLSVTYSKAFSNFDKFIVVLKTPSLQTQLVLVICFLDRIA